MIGYTRDSIGLDPDTLVKVISVPGYRELFLDEGVGMDAIK